tara:strand:- start:322 stop:855 length:534 start_codon:yes stop_codon:yes gene_type:complete
MTYNFSSTSLSLLKDRPALKEYSPIIELLATEKQFFILRKQKILMDGFWLYPIYSYKKKNFKEFISESKIVKDQVPVQYMAKPVSVKSIDRKSIIKLDSNFGWNLDHVLDYMGGRAQIYIIFLRIYRLEKAVYINEQKGVNFVKVNVSSKSNLKPVLTDKEFSQSLKSIERIIKNDK